MPYAKKSRYRRRRSYRKSYRRSFKKYSRKTRVYRPLPLILPDKYMTKLMYNGHFSLNPGALALPDVHVFRLNSIYDFDKTATGHLVSGYTMLSKMYNEYRVLSVKAVMTPIYDSTSSSIPGMYGMRVSHTDGETAAMQWDEIMQSEQKTKKIRQAGILQLSGPVGNQPCKLFWSGKKDIGKNYLYEDSYAGTFGYNPSTVIYLDCYYMNAATVDVGTVNFNIYVEMIVKLNDIKTQTDDI